MEKITTKSGEFKYNKKENLYEMINDKYTIVLECDDNTNSTCEKALETFKRYEDNLEELDKKFKNYAAKEMIDTANDWLEEETPIIEEELSKRINSPYIIFHSNSSIEAYYKDDDIFAGHLIFVSKDTSGIINYVTLMG